MESPWIFSEETSRQLHRRIDALKPDTKPLWGIMSSAQMLAHCCVPYEQALGDHSHPLPIIMKWLVRLFSRDLLVGEKPYGRSTPTAPAMKINDERDFEREKARLKDLIVRFQQKGEQYFEGREQITLGALTAKEWHTLIYKHLDHHLTQFGT